MGKMDHTDSKSENSCALTDQLSMIQMSKGLTCGKCIPCFEGLPQLEQMLMSVIDGSATLKTLKEMKELTELLRDMADCSIGYQAAVGLLKSLKEDEAEYLEHINHHCCPKDK